jgi:hypothetical protein
MPLKIINSPGSSTLSTLQEKRTVLLLELRRLRVVSPRTKTSFFDLQNPSIECEEKLQFNTAGSEYL